MGANLLLCLLRDHALVRVGWLTISKFKQVASTGHVIAQHRTVYTSRASVREFIPLGAVLLV